MKVSIKPYPNWWGPYQITGLLQKVGVSEKKCRMFGNLLADTMFADACQAVQDFKVKYFYKDKIVIEPHDTWSMDTTLAKIVLPMLKQLRLEKQGSPGCMMEFAQVSDSSQRCFDFYAEGDDAAWDAGHARWLAILDQMIWSFEQVLDDSWEEQFFVEGFDSNGYHAYANRIQIGLDLFGKHYRSLWD
jgi:hypothetical protein